MTRKNITKRPVTGIVPEKIFRPERVSVPKKVFLVYYDSNHGGEFSIHATFDGAKCHAEKWMMERWDEIGEEEYCYTQVDEMLWIVQWSHGASEYMSTIETNLEV
jgi:hypothetical protein